MEPLLPEFISGLNAQLNRAFNLGFEAGLETARANAIVEQVCEGLAYCYTPTVFATPCVFLSSERPDFLEECDYRIFTGDKTEDWNKTREQHIEDLYRRERPQPKANFNLDYYLLLLKVCTRYPKFLLISNTMDCEW